MMVTGSARPVITRCSTNSTPLMPGSCTSSTRHCGGDCKPVRRNVPAEAEVTRVPANRVQHAGQGATQRRIVLDHSHDRGGLGHGLSFHAARAKAPLLIA